MPIMLGIVLDAGDKMESRQTWLTYLPKTHISYFIGYIF